MFHGPDVVVDGATVVVCTVLLVIDGARVAGVPEVTTETLADLAAAVVVALVEVVVVAAGRLSLHVPFGYFLFPPFQAKMKGKSNFRGHNSCILVRVYTRPLSATLSTFRSQIYPRKK